MEARKLLLIMALATMVVIGTGCAGKYTGGGWIEGAEGGKANFGFNMQSDGLGGVKGQVQFHDHSNDVKFHGVVDDMEWSSSSGTGAGIATVNPGGETGPFEIYVEDNGEPGNMGSEDYIEVWLWTGYSHGGYLGGGNIQYHGPE